MCPFISLSAGGVTLIITTYNLMMLLAFCSVVGYGWARRERMLLSGDNFWGLITAVAAGGMAGAKLFYIVNSWAELGPGLSVKLSSVMRLSRGWGFYGGLAGASAAAAYFLSRNKIPVRRTADLFAPAAALGGAIMRLGCFSAGCCYGRITGVPWAVSFPRIFSRIPEQLQGIPLHPTQLYESLGNLALFGALHFLTRKYDKVRRPPGSLFLGYVCGYSALRFFVEFFRAQGAGYAGGLTGGQKISVIAVLAAAALFAGNYRGLKNGGPE